MTMMNNTPEESSRNTPVQSPFGVSPEAPAPSRRPWLILGACAVALGIAAGFGVMTLSGDDDKAISAGLVAAGSTPTSGSSPSASPSASPSRTAYRGGTGTDPFAPLIAPAKNAASGGDSESSPSPSPSPVASSGGQSARAATAQTIKLVATSGDKAKFTVGKESFLVTAGSSFATYFRLLSVEGSCATIEYGEVGAGLCRGQSVTLR